MWDWEVGRGLEDGWKGTLMSGKLEEEGQACVEAWFQHWQNKNVCTAKNGREAILLIQPPIRGDDLH
jgi:hypothetical protein